MTHHDFRLYRSLFLHALLVQLDCALQGSPSLHHVPLHLNKCPVSLTQQCTGNSQHQLLSKQLLSVLHALLPLVQKCSATLHTLFRYTCDKLCFFFWTELSKYTSEFVLGRDRGIV